MTAGTAITEAMGLLKTAQANVVGACIALNRQEKTAATDTCSAIQRFEAAFHIPVLSIATLDGIIAFLKARRKGRKPHGMPLPPMDVHGDHYDKEDSHSDDHDDLIYVRTMEEYRQEFGISMDS